MQLRGTRCVGIAATLGYMERAGQQGDGEFVIRVESEGRSPVSDLVWSWGHFNIKSERKTWAAVKWPTVDINSFASFRSLDLTQ